MLHVSWIFFKVTTLCQPKCVVFHYLIEITTGLIYMK